MGPSIKQNEESSQVNHDECKVEEKYLREYIEILKIENNSTEKLASRLIAI